MAPKGKNKGKGKSVPNNQIITPPSQASTTAIHTSTSSPSMPLPYADQEFTMISTPRHITKVVPPSPPPLADPVPTPTHDSKEGTKSGAVKGSSAVQAGHGPTEEQRIPLIRAGRKSWYPATQAMHEVTHTIQKLYERPVESFSKLTKEEKQRWFLEWKSHFIIHPKDEKYMFKLFKSRVAYRLQDMYIDIWERRDESPKWMTQASLDTLWQYWRSERFKEKSLKNKANELKRRPTQSELFRKTHMHKIEKTWVDPCSENVWHAHEQRNQEDITQREQRIIVGENCPLTNEDQLWQEAVSGPYKNCIYGMRSFSSSSSSSASVNGPSIGTQYTAIDDEVREQVHLLNAELHRMQEKDAETERRLQEMKKKMEDMEKKEKAMLTRIRKQMKKEMMSVWKKMRASPSIPPDFDDDDDGDGGNDAGADDGDDAANFS